MFRKLTIALAIVTLASLLLPGETLAQGCAMCQTALKDGPDPLSQSLASSILFMVSMPFLLFFSVAGWLVLMFRRSGNRDQPTATEETPR